VSSAWGKLLIYGHASPVTVKIKCHSDVELEVATETCRCTAKNPALGLILSPSYTKI